MTVQEQNLVQYYDGPILSGTVLPIAEFSFLENSHVAVKIRGVAANLVYGTDYTISGAQTSNRTLTILKDVLSTETLVAFLDVPITQGMSPEEGGNFPAATQEYAFDKITQICAKLYERISRSFQASIDSTFDGTLYGISDNKGKALIVNATGTGIDYSDESLSDIVSTVETLTDEAIAQATIATIKASEAATSEISADLSADKAATSEINADLSANRAETAALGLETIVPIVGSDGKYPKVKTPYTEGYEFVELFPQLPVNDLGSKSVAFDVTTNTATKVALTAAVDITLPTSLIAGVENRVIIDFSSAIAAKPNLVTTGVLCWSNINGGRPPSSVSNSTTIRNQFILSTIDGGAHWNVEYRTYTERSSDTVLFGYYIDTTDSNPATRVHYIQDNADFVDPSYMNYAGGVFHYGDWEDAFFMPTPVMLSYTGVVSEYLDKNDYTKQTNGSASSIANTSFSGNAMMQWPVIYTKRYTDGNYQYVLKSNKQIDSSYKKYSWYDKNNSAIDYCYTGIYQGANVSSVLRSLSGQTILTNAAGTTEIAYAQANGAANGWNIGIFSDWLEIQELLVLMCKSTDIQGKFGQGRSSAANATTGECNLKGLFYGTSGNGPLKIFGMENYYANYWKRTAGCVYTASGWKIKLTEGTVDGSTATSYNADGTGYIIPGLSVTGTSGGFISSATLTQYGFIPTAVSGSSSTYFCDGCWYAAGGYAFVGGAYDNGLSDGAFALFANSALSYADYAIGASLSCKPPL